MSLAKASIPCNLLFSSLSSQLICPALDDEFVLEYAVFSRDQVKQFHYLIESNLSPYDGELLNQKPFFCYLA